MCVAAITFFVGGFKILGPKNVENEVLHNIFGCLVNEI